MKIKEIIARSYRGLWVIILSAFFGFWYFFDICPPLFLEYFLFDDKLITFLKIISVPFLVVLIVIVGALFIAFIMISLDKAQSYIKEKEMRFKGN